MRHLLIEVKKLKKSYKWGLLFVVIVLSVSVFWVTKNNKETGSDVAEDNSEVSITSKTRDLSWVDDVHAAMLDDWKSGDKTFDERLVQEVMLKMTYQKLDTLAKDGSIDITPERIENLMQIAEEEKAVFFNSDTYLEILKRWKENDFSTVEDDNKLLHSLYDR
ncbi:DUF6241 domain-containing protein [Lysinibacillus sp. NPDC093712]|uniref:DUF6241 domain-containing protein n=1 Tax=Lysinibacillus sp. NPDC093712 TaxID=3390579 RepID=UPI003D012C5D